MSITNSNVSYSGLVEKYIGTAYDTVKLVADNMEHVIAIGAIDGIEDIADDLAEAVIVVNNAVIAAETASTSAETAAGIATTAATQASQDASDAASDALATANDVETTNGNAVSTAGDVVTTNANVIATNIDAAATEADATQTLADKTQTQIDVVTTAANAADASVAKTGAEAALYTFQGQYLGASATAPTLDNNGDALTPGDLYQDTAVTPNLMMFWNGANWLQAFSVVDAVAHSALTGLGNDDHAQYLNDVRHALISGNPHNVNQAEVGLSDVDNTSDVNKPVSTATGVALLEKVDAPSTAPTVGGQVLVTSLGGVTAWELRVTPIEFANGLAGKENALGNPPSDGRIIESDTAGNRVWVDNVKSFLELIDTESDYTGKAGQVATVNGTEDGITLVALSALAHIGLTPPVSPGEGASWFNSNNGQIYTFYTSPINGSQQWIKDNLKVR